MRTRVQILGTLAFLFASCLNAQESASQRKLSSFGVYEGYSQERFSEWVTNSVYVEMRDGVKLAVDITRPAVNGNATDEPLPVVWTHSRYHRNVAHALGSPQFESMVDTNPGLQRLVRHGYVLAAACVRGGGASTGTFEGLFSEPETLDSVELIDWFVAQPWCDGNIGMHGGSYLGITQYMTAGQAPEALKAIAPDVAAFDMYTIVHPGGIFRRDTFQHWSDLTRMLDLQVTAEKVDTDHDGSILKQSRADHADNWPVIEGYASARFRDSDSDLHDWSNHGPAPFLDDINDAGVPIYHLNGWYDVFALDTTLFFANYDGPQRMMMGDWSHAQSTMARATCTAIEQHRWFDRWLKGIENGVDEEPRIQFRLMVEPGEAQWVEADTWPLPGIEQRTLFLASGPSGSVESINDGRLSAAAGEPDSDEYQVDPTTTTGSSTRWDNAVGAAPIMRYPDLATNDTKCLTYTTAPLEEDWTVIGHPVVHLALTSSSGDADLHILLEEVSDSGDVRYVTEGVLRASNRQLEEAPYDNLGLPYQPCTEAAVKPLSAEEPEWIAMDLHPTATVFNQGHRIRLVIMGADADNTELSDASKDALLELFTGGELTSRLELPVQTD